MCEHDVDCMESSELILVDRIVYWNANTTSCSFNIRLDLNYWQDK